MPLGSVLPANRRPRSVKDGSLIYFGRLVRDPHDIRVFGRAIGMAHVPGRDDATQTDILLRPWKETWSRYIRVHDAEFVSGTMENGVSLNELMNVLGKDSFASTSAIRKPDEATLTREEHMDSRPMSSFQRKVCVGCLNGSKVHLQFMPRSRQTP